MNVYPAEIENALSEHPGVALAVAIGLPDRDLGAVVHAIVNLSPDAPEAPTAGELGDFIATRLARYKLPASYEFTDEPLRDEAGTEIGRAPVATPVTNAHIVCRLLLDKDKVRTHSLNKNTTIRPHHLAPERP